MARVYGIKKRLEQSNVDAKLVKEVIGNSDLVDIILRMEKLLDPDMMCQILDSQGCSGGKEYIKKCERIGKELAGKPLNDKINYINSSSPDSEHVTLNDDNTLTAGLRYEENESYKCVCSAAVNKRGKVSELALKNDSDDRVMPLSYCICCAGSYRRHLQLQLGVELKTKEILSSPINSKGEKPCELILEIV